MYTNCLEMKAALFALQSLSMGYKNIHTRLLSDSFTTVSIFGSAKGKCNDVSKEIWLFCIKMNNFVQAVHLPISPDVILCG